MKAIQQNPHIIDSLSCIPYIYIYIYIYIYTVERIKVYNYILMVNNETQCVPLLFLSSRFMTCTPSFILGKLFLEKEP